MKCRDHDWAFDRREIDGETLVAIYKCTHCQLEAIGERIPYPEKVLWEDVNVSRM